jgi:aryl-alcohol dehydrogenase-like predicted oxidoreductase
LNPTFRLGGELDVCRLGFGAMRVVEDPGEGVRVLRRAVELGVTLVDTADIYGGGRSEEFIGRALEGRRDAVLVATKFGKPMSERPADARGAPEYVRWAIEGSLRRLRTDYVDVYQMHEPDPGTPIEETLGTLDELVREGKVRFIGSSNFSPAQVEEADGATRERDGVRFVSAQNEYSLLERQAEDGLLPTCVSLGVGVLPYFPLASGLLTGKYRRGAVAREGRLAGREIPAERWQRVEALERFAEERGVALLDVAVGGLAAMPAVVSVIAGATKREQVRANVRAGEWAPSESDVEALRELR